LKDVASQTRYVDVATIRDTQHVPWRLDGAKDSAALEINLHQLPRERVVGDVLSVVAMGQHPHLARRRDEETLGAPEVIPDSQQRAVHVEDLDAIVLAITDVDTICGVDGDRVRDPELARPIARVPQAVRCFPVLSNFTTRVFA
jgi:hypothetical protein